VSENYGDSELAKRFGVKRYPAIFVDDILVATPKDFGFYGKGEGSRQGRYAPFVRNAANHERFQSDLRRMIGLILSGRKEEARKEAAPADTGEIATFPAVTITGIDGKSLSRKDLEGKVVLVDFWATWCPPCLASLPWYGELKKQYGDRLVVIAIAVDSEEADVRKLAAERKLPFVWTMGTPELGRAFGDVSAVPTLFVFDGQGRNAGAFYGAPPTLHKEVEAKLGTVAR
jgi:thiol-disulfide isomerase/thioredoxin